MAPWIVPEGGPPAGMLERARALRAAFDALWPPAMALAGLLLIAAFVLVPGLRDPALIAAISGLWTVVSAAGLARRESR